MARQIPGPKPGSLVEFVPTVFGNDSDETPIRVFLKAPSEADKRQHIADTMRHITFKAGAQEPVTLSFGDVLERKKKAIERFVSSVENYADQAGLPIATAKDLWERGELAICNEVEAHIESLMTLSEGEQKKSAGSPSSSLPVTPRSNGTAPTVAPKASAVRATATAQPAIQTSTTPLQALA